MFVWTRIPDEFRHLGSVEFSRLVALGTVPWPGNVRQLENAIARLAALATGTTLRLDDWTEQNAQHPTSPAEPAGAPDDGESAGTAELGPSLKEQVEAFERALLARMLAATNGNQSEAARRLGTSRVTLVDKLKKYGLTARRND
jgi:two-component system response regulator AtoC